MANAGFRFFNSDVAESITSTGQLYLRSIEKHIDKLLCTEFKIPFSNFCIYADTDSVVGDTIINVNGIETRIDEYYDSFSNFAIEDISRQNFVKPTTSDLTPSINIETQDLEYKNIKYVMKHKVKKVMFKISCGGKSVTVTQDHSIIVRREGKIQNVKPSEILPGDEIIDLET